MNLLTTKTSKLFLAALTSFFLLQTTVFANSEMKGELGILDLSANNGINPATNAPWEIGDQYRLVFVSSTSRDASTTDLTVYDSFLQQLADDAGIGGTWKVIGSSDSVDAKDHTSSNPSNNGSDASIILIDGQTIIANNYADLWDGSLDSKLNIDEQGNTNINRSVFTGTNSNGTKRDRHLGGSDESTPKVTIGNTDRTNSRWLVIYNSAASSQQVFYAISDVLTVRSSGTTISGTIGGNDSWNNSINWDGGVPNGDIDVTIEKNTSVYVNNPTTAPYTGVLALNENSLLNMYDSVGSAFAATSATSITLGKNSTIVLNLNHDITLAPITLKGDAMLESVIPKSDWETTNLSSIDGSYKITLKGFNGHTFNLNETNTFKELKSIAHDRYNIRAKAAGSLGLGDVTIEGRADGRSAQLYLDVANTIADTATLTLNGKGFDNNNDDRITIASGINEVVKQLVVDGTGLPAGTYNNSQAWLSGAGTLTVLEDHLDTGSIAQGIIKSNLNWPHSMLGNDGSGNIPSFKDVTAKGISIVNQFSDTFISKNEAIRFEGLFYVPTSDTYNFDYNEGAYASFNFYIKDMENPLLSHTGNFIKNRYAQIYLEEGYHKFAIDAMSATGGDYLYINWTSSQTSSSSNGSQYLFHNTLDLAKANENLDGDGDGLTDTYEDEIGTDKNNADSDGDGLTDKEELAYNTNPNSADSDQNGVSDFDQIKIFNIQGNDSSLGQISETLTIAPSSYISKAGCWNTEDDKVKTCSFRGSLNYIIDVPQDDMMLLEVTGLQTNLTTANAPFELDIWVDDEFIGRKSIQNKSSYRDNNFGLSFEGSIQVPTAGVYNFYTNSDDGSQLFINGQLIVDNDGNHGMQERTGSINLPEGSHSIKVIYYQGGGGFGLDVLYDGPGITKRTIPASTLSQLTWEYFEGSWSSLPDFNSLQPVSTGVCSTFTLEARKYPTTNSARILLPYLQAGNHTLKILLDRNIYGSEFRFESIKLLTVAGTDNDGNGLKDWIDNKLALEENVKSSNSSKISPACIEGNSNYPAWMTSSTGSIIKKGAGKTWFSNITLDPNGPTNVQFGFQNGAKNINKSITWEPTMVATENTIFVRAGDSLLFDPTPGSINVSSTLDIDGSSYPVAAGALKTHQFNNAGTYVITSDYTYNNQAYNHSMSVVVVGTQLQQTTLAGLIGVDRRITLDSDPNTVYQTDKRLNAWYKVNGEYVFNLDKKEERSIAARAGQNGPIIGSFQVQGLDVVAAGYTWFELHKTYLDGSQRINMAVVAYPMLDDLEIHLDIFLPGILFTDGSSNKVLRKTDFNDYQQLKIDFLKSSAGPNTSACHNIDLWQDGKFVGRSY